MITNHKNNRRSNMKLKIKLQRQKSIKFCGLPYENGLFEQDPDWCNKIIPCAPGEEQKPIPLLTDQRFEQLSNQEKNPDSQNGFLSERETSTSTEICQPTLAGCWWTFCKVNWLSFRCTIHYWKTNRSKETSTIMSYGEQKPDLLKKKT